MATVRAGGNARLRIADCGLKETAGRESAICNLKSETGPRCESGRSPLSSGRDPGLVYQPGGQNVTRRPIPQDASGEASRRSLLSVSALWPPLPRLEGLVELMDQPCNSSREVEEALRDLGHLNRYLGGVRTVRWHLGRMIAAQAETTITILDIATGGADIPRALCRWARRRGLRLAIEALDRSPQVLGAARAWCAAYPEIRLRHGEAPPLPYPDGSFDYAITSLFLHHLPEDHAVILLREMGRVARRGLIVSDLRRSRTARHLTALATRLLSRNRLTRHDGPISILRAFRPEELRRMAAHAGLREARVRLHPWFRVALVHAHGSRAPASDATPWRT